MTREEAIEKLDICIAHMKRIKEIFEDMFRELEQKDKEKN